MAEFYQNTDKTTDVWLTPPDLINSLGVFDIDPCCPNNLKWKTATNYYSLDKFSNNCIIWYKPETINEVHWAGDPNKAIEKDKNGLSPRKSFDLWSQKVKDQSNAWKDAELFEIRVDRVWAEPINIIKG